MDIHPGITMHSIPAAGTGGLIFALGIAALFLLQIPSFAPVVAACVLGGLAVAPLLRRLTPVPATNVAGALPLFLAGLGLALAVSPAFSALVAICAGGGFVAAFALNRASQARRPVSIRSL